MSEGIELADIYDWWWKLDAMLRVEVCLPLGGSVGDAGLTDPPDYLADYVLYERPNLIYEVHR